MARLAAIVLAAGRSSRMGELKPLLPLGDAVAITRAAGSFLEAGIADVRVVVGWRGDEVAAAAADLGVAIVVNDGWERGMFSSVAVGVASLPADVEAFFLLPADCAVVRSETIGRLARLAEAQSQPAPVVYPAHGGRRGHPPLIARAALPAELRWEPSANRQWEPAGGLRGLLAACDAAAVEVEVDDEGVVLDMDAPPDYRRACDYIAGECIPDAGCCLSILRDACVPPAVVAHSRAVADVAAGLTERLNERGLHLNARLIEAAALLHDIARTSSDHARAGAELLGGLGYRRVAAVTVHHMDLQDEAEVETVPGEAEILYLADKLVAGTCVVALRERLAARLGELQAQPEGQTHARVRLERALAMADGVERLIGEPAETVARRALAAAAGGAVGVRL